MRISDWSSDVGSSDLVDGCCCWIAPRGIVVDAGSLAQHLPRGATGRHAEPVGAVVPWRALPRKYVPVGSVRRLLGAMPHNAQVRRARVCDRIVDRIGQRARPRALPYQLRSEEHTSELQSLMRISYAVFCLKKKTNNITYKRTDNH